jgi:cytochrome c peroxidase
MRSDASCLLRTAAVGLFLFSASCRDSPTATVPLEEMDAPVLLAKTMSNLPFSESLAELGDEIFEDTNLSIGRNQSCETCHFAEWGFTGPDSHINAAGAVYEGSIPGAFGDRKPPSSAYSTLPPILHRTRQAGGMFVGGNFFDGRATGEKLGNPAADQAQGPFLNPVEQALPDAACVVYRVAYEADYIDDYLEHWGDNIHTINFPAAEEMDDICSTFRAQAGEYVPLSPADRAKVNQEYDNIAISIAVYEESHNLFTSKFDAARKGLYRFTKEEQKGLALFQGKAGCAGCHPSNGQRPAFTDHTYDNLGVPKNPQNPIYNTHPSYVDLGLGGFLATRPEWIAYAFAERGKMRVPTLRNVDLRPQPTDVKAYMHNGVFKSLEEVVRFYNTRDALPRCPSDGMEHRSEWGRTCWPAPEAADNVNTAELGNLGLTADEEAAIVAFLTTLSDGFISSDTGRHLRGKQ